MGILKDIFSSGTSKLVDAVGNAIDKNVTSKEERLQLKNEFTTIIQDHEFRMQNELTTRHKADMVSDSWLSKNIRPMTLIFLLSFMSTITIWDSVSISFSVEEAYIILLKTLLITVFIFYFGDRFVNKAIINYNGKGDK